MTASLNNIVALLTQQENVTVISHRSPDGDTLGSAVALGLALRQAGKDVDFLCHDQIPQKFHYLFAPAPEWLKRKEDPIAAAKGRFLIAVDVADPKLMGDSLQALSDQIDLCIDHHKMSVEFAKVTYREADSAATGEIIYTLLCQMGTTITPEIAGCIYTAVSTDTGCFKYVNTTPRTLRIAADMVESGAPASDINRWMFDTITRGRLELQKLALETLEYPYDGRCVTMVISREMMKQAGASGEDVEGINGIPRQIDGALVGITIREKKSGGYKISMRSQPPVDSSAICAVFGGGGHVGAAGCTFDEPLECVKEKLVKAVGDYFTAHGIL
ncbi:MAG: DHH family phosphoesterase [Oscillospiraceae bacterium]|nr:DHH family phosphoesterase [Oscillospiraceae bacterium]